MRWRCDDGNDIETDDCLGDCRAAVCGDGNVHEGIEACDDGMGSQECDADCTLPHCGDGVHNEFAGEACDDGNPLDTDECVQGCVFAVCGDGFVHAGVELCDPGEEPSDECDEACKPQLADLRPNVLIQDFTYTKTIMGHMMTHA